MDANDEYESFSRDESRALTPPPSSDIFACDECDDSEESNVRFCYKCDLAFCLQHWLVERQHNPLHRNFSAHKQTPIAVARFARLNLGNDEHDPSTRARLHREDSDTLWFGVDAKDSDKPSFINNDVYQELISRSAFIPRESQFPRLVSFVGDTGAGKSTLIKSMILLKESRDKPLNLPMPIPGTCETAGAAVTSDVHLYGDPATLNTRNPIMFADCEGLTGGEPEATKHEDEFFRMLLKLRRNFRLMNLPFGRKLTRKYCVEDLYPRMLYSFSDVVCFVTQQTNVGQDLVTKLIVWADKVLAGAINQPVLPSAIIVLNGTRGHSDTWLDENIATQDIWLRINNSAELNEAVRPIAAAWEKRIGSASTTRVNLKTLAEHYFSDIRFVHIPDKKTAAPETLWNQLEKLYNRIDSLSTRSQKEKYDGWAQLNSNQLELYLNWAFDHFARKPEEPFDFHAVALAHSPLPSGLTEHMVSLMTLVAKSWTGVHSSSDVSAWQSEVADLLASYLFVMTSERDFITHPEKVFETEFKSVCEDAYDSYYAQAECDFRRGDMKCVNVLNHHSKGHQGPNGQILGKGDYLSRSSDGDKTNFIQTIAVGVSENAERIAEFKNAPATYRKYALEEHADILKKHEILRSIVSNSTCLGCLTSQPAHVLPCRKPPHALCQKCVQRFGKQDSQDEHSFVIKSCPLCRSSTSRHGEAWTMRFKPKEVSPRILCLDGGGIRGIISIKILALLEAQLGLNIPIHQFFDMIIGTSAGGIIALGLGCNMWSAESACEQFKSIVKESFQEQKGIFDSFWPLSSFAKLLRSWTKRYKYDAITIESQLKGAFGFSGPLFGNCGWEAHARNGDKQRDLKIAVITNDCVNSDAVLLANYNRLKTAGGIEIYRNMVPDHDLRVWEAARCTSAVPFYFPPYKTSGREFQDGGVVHNCPLKVSVEESQTLWSDSCEPGLVVTVGSGGGSKPPEAQKREAPTPSRGLFSRVLESFASLRDPNVQWQKFIRKVPSDERARYRRLNVDMKELPELADTTALDRLEAYTLQSYKPGKPGFTKLRHTADALVANLFYLESCGSTEVANDIYDITGTICCNLEHKYQVIVAQELREHDRRFNINGIRVALTADDMLSVKSGKMLRFEFSVTVPKVDSGLAIKLESRQIGASGEYDININPCAFY